MPWEEATTQPPIEYSNLSGALCLRTFKVWGGVSPNTIIQDPANVLNDAGVGLPAYDSIWPGGESWADHATLEKWTVQVVEGDFIEATAVYSDRRTRGTHDSSFQTELENVTYAAKLPIVVPVVSTPDMGVAPLSGPNAMRWFEVSFQQPSSCFRVRKTFYVTLTALRARDPVTHIHVPISRQINHIHNIGAIAGPPAPGGAVMPLYARFESADVHRLTWDRYAIAYSWVVDSGIPFPADGAADLIGAAVPAGAPGDVSVDPANFYFPSFVSRLYGPGPTPQTAVRWLRPPFETVRCVSRAALIDPLNLLPPLFYSLISYGTADPEGWRTLPQ